jgi:adenylate kinase
MVEQRLAKPDAVQGAILDGYPRSRGQASFLDELLSRKGAKIAVVPLLTLDRETAIKRAEGRRFSPDGKRVYNIYFNPPQKPGVDDVTGESLIQRDDDYREAVERRIDLFMEKTMPLINYYKERGVLEEINADQPVCEVAIDLLAAIVRKMLV